MVDIVHVKFRGVGRSNVVTAELCVVPKICDALTGQTVEFAKITYTHLIDVHLADSTDGKTELPVNKK